MTAADTELAVRQFNLAVGEFTKARVPEMVLASHRWLVLAAVDKIKFKSPRRTGRFVGNWQTTAGEPAVGEIPAAVAISRGRDGMSAQAAATVRALKPYDTAWITNNVPYAIRLEEGHSKKQAPLGMVGVTVTELRNDIVPDSALSKGR